MAPLPTSCDVLVIGAGFAGASAARALARAGAGRVLVLEQESIFGLHGSGRNAAMARRVIEEPVLADLATRSVAAMRALGERRGLELYRPTGGLLLGSLEDLRALEASAREVPDLAGDVELSATSELVREHPLLTGVSSPWALRCSGCGIVDIHALLLALLDEAREAGATIVRQVEVLGVDVQGGRVRGVSTSAGRVSSGVVLNAAGFRVAPLGAHAGAAPIPFDPVRRHLFVSATGGLEVDPGGPFVWDASCGYYFRPEGAGLLLCCCDETPWPPEDPPTDPTVRERLAEVFSAHVPALRELRPARAWCGLRVLTPDGRFVIGPDPDLEGLHWVAGLGGHGMTTSLGVGDLAAASVLEGILPEPFGAAFDPGRFRGA